jgi:hypothetical protein
MLSWTAEGLEEPSVRLASIAMPESLLMFTVSVDWLLHAIAKRINTEIIYIFINITTYGVIPRLSNDILDRRIRPTAFFWMLQSPSSISLFLPLSFYVHQHINFCIDMNSGHFCSRGAVSKSALRGGKAAPEHIWLHWQNSPAAIQPHADHQNLNPIKNLWLFSLICMAAAAGAAFPTRERYS